MKREEDKSFLSSSVGVESVTRLVREKDDSLHCIKAEPQKSFMVVISFVYFVITRHFLNCKLRPGDEQQQISKLFNWVNVGYTIYNS